VLSRSQFAAGIYLSMTDVCLLQSCRVVSPACHGRVLAATASVSLAETRHGSAARLGERYLLQRIIDEALASSFDSSADLRSSREVQYTGGAPIGGGMGAKCG